jgi:Tol biopolymer transport system component
LFSEIKQGLHLVLVTTDEARGQSRDVYVPPGERSMVHHSYLSPDGRWVLLVTMDSRGEVTPCVVVPFDGSGNAKAVGPPQAPCTSGAWSPDGKWIYVSSNKGGAFHIWRQEFPNGSPQQVTSGTTEEEGIAMSSDGKSLLTSVGTRDFTVWIHDAKGDRQLSSEGNAYEARFSQDGSKLYYMQDNGQNSGVDLVVMELASGKTERLVSSSAVLPGSEMENYDVSHDGKQVAFSLRDQQGISHMWLSPTDHRSSPHELISATSQDSPFFLPDGDLLLRSAEGGQNFAYRTSQDGTKRQKVIPEPVLELRSISPDGRWLVAATTRADAEHETAIRVYPVDGGPPVFLCTSLCENHWDASGRFFYFNPRPAGAGKTYVLPVNPARGLPNFLPSGDESKDESKADKRFVTLPPQIDSAAGPSLYAYTRQSTKRNIYRIPLPQ